jgi:hypothetical protein
MEATNDEATYLLIHRLAAGPNGRLCLLKPERVEVPGSESLSRRPVDATP